MKTLILLLCLLIGGAFVQEAPKPKCGGVDRWDVKTMTDKEAKKVKLTAVKTSIAKLRAFKPGKKIGDKTPRFNEEFQVYEIICTVTYYSKEEDGDYHLVLADTADPKLTIIGEIPDPLCDRVQPSAQIEKISSARVFFVENVKGKANKPKKGIWKIKGVAFYDRVHGQKGVAPNGFELHPILSIKKIK
jgi:hypothetical protein